MQSREEERQVVVLALSQQLHLVGWKPFVYFHEWEIHSLDIHQQGYPHSLHW